MILLLFVFACVASFMLGLAVYDVWLLDDDYQSVVEFEDRRDVLRPQGRA